MFCTLFVRPVILLDFNASFDKVDISFFWDRLEVCVGMSNTDLRGFLFYLRNRPQFISEVICGVLDCPSKFHSGSLVVFLLYVALG